MVPQDEAHSHPENAHYGHVVDGDTHVLGIIERGNLNLPRLPGQEGAKELQQRKKDTTWLVNAGRGGSQITFAFLGRWVVNNL